MKTHGINRTRGYSKMRLPASSLSLAVLVAVGVVLAVGVVRHRQPTPIASAIAVSGFAPMTPVMNDPFVERARAMAATYTQWVRANPDKLSDSALEFNRISDPLLAELKRLCSLPVDAGPKEYNAALNQLINPKGWAAQVG